MFEFFIIISIILVTIMGLVICRDLTRVEKKLDMTHRHVEEIEDHLDITGEIRNKALDDAAAIVRKVIAECERDRNESVPIPFEPGEPDPNGCDQCDSLNKIVASILAQKVD